MTNRVSYAPQDFQKMCKQAERDHESKKLVVLMERVKRQIAERENPGRCGESKRPASRWARLRFLAAAQPLGSVREITAKHRHRSIFLNPFLHRESRVEENFSLSTCGFALE